jgi:signal peptide peptidase SppA
MSERIISLSERFFNVPLALLPARAPTLLEVEGLRVSRGRAAMAGAGQVDRRLYDVVDGVAVVPIQGILLHGDACWWGEMSYSAITDCLVMALADPEVRAIALHVDSPGGEVAGCFDLADTIFAMRGLKPIVAIVDENAYSAAYALASAADQIFVPKTGGVGSIGVITMNVDVTKALEQFGMKVTTIQFGSHKSDSYPTTPLSDEARALMQTDIDALGEMFVSLVARNRGITPEAVRSTQAGTFLGEASVTAGLADAVMAADDAFLMLIKQIAA